METQWVERKETGKKAAKLVLRLGTNEVGVKAEKWENKLVAHWAELTVIQTVHRTATVKVVWKDVLMVDELEVLKGKL